VLYDPRLTAAKYQAWLRSVGVRYVLLPDAPLDYSSVAEARLLRSGRSGLAVVRRMRHWTVYELARATPILTGDPPAGGAYVIRLSDSRIRVWLPAAGAYDLRVRYSPYWSVDTPGVCLSPTRAGMTVVRTVAPGAVAIEFEPTLATVAAAAASESSPCAT